MGQNLVNIPCQNDAQLTNLLTGSSPRIYVYLVTSFQVKVWRRRRLLCNQHLMIAVAIRRCSSKRVFLKILQNSQENTVLEFFFFFIKKETPAEGFSFEFCEIYKNTIIYSAPLVAGSVMSEAVSLQLFKIGFVAGK